MGKFDAKKSAEKYASTVAVLHLGAKTLMRQHGIGKADAILAINMASIDILTVFAPNAILPIISSQVAIQKAVMAKNGKATKRAVKRHTIALDKFYDEGMAAQVRTDGRLV